MLTSDLLRVELSGDRIAPQYLDVDDGKAQRRAARLVEIFDGHCGDPYGVIDDRVERAIGHGTDFLIWRGLAKLLYDRSEFEVDAPQKPEEIREVVFDTAVDAGNPTDDAGRRAVLDEAADILEIDADVIETSLYADLEDRQILAEFDSLEPLELLHRYNLALAQAVLYRARNMRIEFQTQDSNRLRRLFQMLKFHRLMHRTRRTDDGYVLEVDGPESVFNRGRKYGVQMATFLPALLHLSDWSMRAEIEWDDELYDFVVDENTGLQTSRRARGQWIADEEEWFEERFEQKAPEGWSLERRGEVVELSDNEVLITDYVVHTADGDEVWIEIVGFWRIGYLKRRLQRLADMDADPPVVLVVSERLKTDREELDRSPAQVVFFKTAILVGRVVDAVRNALGGD